MDKQIRTEMVCLKYLYNKLNIEYNTIFIYKRHENYERTTYWFDRGEYLQ